MSELFSRHVVCMLSLASAIALQVSVGHADDSNQKRRRQQQQQPQEVQQQQKFVRPNAFLPPRYPMQQRPAQPQEQFERPNGFVAPRYPIQQQPAQQQRAFTPFQPPQPRAAVNPNAQMYQPPIASSTAQRPRLFTNPNAPGLRTIGTPNPQAIYGVPPGRPLTIGPATTAMAPARVAPFSGIQSAGGQSRLTRRDVLSSPEDRDFLRGLNARQRQALDQYTPEQIQSSQQSGQWAATKQAILYSRSPIQPASTAAVSNPNGSTTSGQQAQSPQSQTASSYSAPANTTTNNTAFAANPPSGSQSNMMGATNTAPVSSPSGSQVAAGAPAGPPPSAPVGLQISGFPASFNASGGGPFQPMIPLSGSGFNAMTQIVWTCTMPSGQACTAGPYNWLPSNWSGKYIVNSDMSATVAPHLLAGGDPAGTYQWTVSFVGNGGKSFVFQLTNSGGAGSTPSGLSSYLPSSLPPPSMNMAGTTPSVCTGPSIFAAGANAVSNSGDVNNSIILFVGKFAYSQNSPSAELQVKIAGYALSFMQTWSYAHQGDFLSAGLTFSSTAGSAAIDALTAELEAEIYTQYHVSVSVSDVTDLASKIVGTYIGGMIYAEQAQHCRA